jgi:hypothetical protein
MMKEFRQHRQAFNPKKGEILMNPILHSDIRRLTVDAKRIKQGLDKLERDCAGWARKLGGKEVTATLGDLEEIEIDVSLMLTDYITTGCTLGEDAPKVVFHDFRRIFGCLDTLFNGLKKARQELAKAYGQEGAVVDHFQIDYGRFRNLLGQIQRHLNENHSQTGLPSGGIHVHQAQDYAITL